MSKKKVDPYLFDMPGVVIKTLINANFLVKLENGAIVNAYLSGKMRKNRIRVRLGDKVLVELSIYDLTRGRVIYRYRKNRRL